MKHLKKQQTETQYETEQYERDSVFATLEQWCKGYGTKHDYIEVTGWYNGEGFDVDIETNQRQRFQLTWGQYEALKHLVEIIEHK